MNLRVELLREHSLRLTNKIIAWIGKDQIRFDEMLKLFLANEPIVSQRIAPVLFHAGCNNPEFISPYLPKIVEQLALPSTHNAQKRNILKVLEIMSAPTDLHDQIISCCFNLYMNKQEEIAVRVFALSVLAEYCTTYPDLKSDLKILIEDELPYATPAMVSRSKKILKKFNRN